MHLITMHKSTKFYQNVIIRPEVIYCSMCKSVILKKNIYKHIHKLDKIKILDY